MHNVCFDFLSSFCLKHFSFYKELSKIYKMFIDLHVKYGTHYLCLILIKLEFSQQIFKKYSGSNFMKIRLVGAELFHTDGQT